MNRTTALVVTVARQPTHPDKPAGEEPAARVYAGTSGWAYPSWKPEFYPAKLPARRFLDFYSSRLNSVEVNYTFRTLPTAPQLAGWLAQVGHEDQPGTEFRFSFKAPQRITHFSRLRDCEPHLHAFCASLAPVAAAGRLGLLLFQLPPTLKADVPLLREFLSCPSLVSAPPVAFEFRHPSWFAEQVFTTLADFRAALCIADTDDLRSPEVHCAPAHTCFRLRRHGGYTPEELAGFARRFAVLAREREVYTYFRHEDEPTGALNAAAFRALLAQGHPGSPASGTVQGSV